MVELGVHGTSNLKVQKGRGKLGFLGCRGGGAGTAGSQESLDSLAVKLHPSTAMPWCEEEAGVKGGRHSERLTAGCECCLWKGGAGGRRGLQPAIGAAVKKQTERNKKTNPNPWWQPASSSWFHKDISA